MTTGRHAGSSTPTDVYEWVLPEGDNKNPMGPSNSNPLVFGRGVEESGLARMRLGVLTTRQLGQSMVTSPAGHVASLLVATFAFQFASQ